MTPTKTSLERARILLIKWIAEDVSVDLSDDVAMVQEDIAQAITEAERRGMERVLQAWPSLSEVGEWLLKFTGEKGYKASRFELVGWLRSEIEKRLGEK